MVGEHVTTQDLYDMFKSLVVIQSALIKLCVDNDLFDKREYDEAVIFATHITDQKEAELVEQSKAGGL